MSSTNETKKEFTSSELSEEPPTIMCKCGSERVTLQSIEDGPEYYQCKDCNRTWYATS